MGVIADKIRRAIFGGEVRDSIADGIEVVEQLREDYDNQVINAGNSNAEIVDARGNYAKLKERLDKEHGEVISQLDTIDIKKANKNDLIFLKTDGIGNKVLLDNGTYADFTDGQVSAVTLYNELGVNEDGAINQKALTDFYKTTWGLESYNLENGYLTIDGSVTSDIVWKTTPYIDLSCIKMKNVNVIGHDSVHSFTFYDKNLYRIGSIKKDTNNQVIVDDDIMIPPNTAFVRISFANTQGYNNVTFVFDENKLSSNFIKKDGDTVKAINEFIEINKIIDKTDFPLDTVLTTAGFYTYEAWYSTGYKEINFTKIMGTLNGYSFIYSIAYFDENKKLISGITSKIDGEDVIITSTPPINAKYYMLCAPMGLKPRIDITLINNVIDKLEYDVNNIKNNIAIDEKYKIKNEYLRVLFKKVLCDGDSLTQGDYGSNPPGTANIHEENYPYFLNKITGWETVNNGECGISTKAFWERRTKNISYDDIDLVIIFLGTNGGLTDTLESDVIGDDYNNYANTNTGSYCKIIEYIKAKKPNMQFCLCTLPQMGAISRVELENTNKVIEKIAHKYNLPIADLYNKSKMNFTNGNIYRPIDNLHFGRLGYLTLAGEIEELFYNYVANNPTTLKI